MIPKRSAIIAGIRLCSIPLLIFSVNACFAQTGDGPSVTELISERCAGCHIKSEYHDDDTGIDAPLFDEIRARPEVYTEERLSQYLINPHWPMSQFTLSSEDIDHIVLYLMNKQAAE